MKNLLTILTTFAIFSGFAQTVEGDQNPMQGTAYTYEYTGLGGPSSTSNWYTSTASTITILDHKRASIIFSEEGNCVITVITQFDGGDPFTQTYNVIVQASPSSTSWEENNDSELYFEGNVGIGNTDPDYKLDVTGDTRVSGTIRTTNHGTSSNWNTAYTQRGSQIAGTGLTYSNGKLNIDEVNTDTQLTEAQVDAFVDNNGFYSSGSNPTFGKIITNLETFTNQEQPTNGANGTVYFDENYYDDFTAITGGNGGGLSILNQDGWGAILATNNMKWITPQFDGLGIGVASPSAGYRVEVNGAIKATGGNSTEWNTAFGWGDHRIENYLKAGESTNFTTLKADKLGIGSNAPTNPTHDLHVRGAGPILGYFQQNASSGDDAGIKIRGSRSGSVSSDIAYVDLANFDSNEGAGTEFVMARIAGGTSVTSGRKGDLKFLTNSGASLTEKMRISHNGNVGIGTSNPSAALHITGTNYNGTPSQAGTQIREGIIELTRNGSSPWIDFQNDIDGTDYDARIALDADNELAIKGAHLSLEDMELRNVKGLQLKDWDDNSGGTNNKYRLLARDGAFQFFNGGMVVGSYGNGTWSDLGDGELRVESNLGIGKTSIDTGYKLDVNGAIQATGGNSNNWNTAYDQRGSQIAGTGLSWTNDKLNINEDDIDALVDNNGYYTSGDNASFGSVSATGGNSTEWNTAYDQRGSAIAGKGLSWSDGKLNSIWTQDIDLTSQLGLSAYYNGSVIIDGNFSTRGTIYSDGGNSTKWNTSYDQRGSQIAGDGLTWSGGKLNATNTNTDDQVIDDFSISGNTLSLSLEDDGESSKTVDLSAFDHTASGYYKNSDDATFNSIIVGDSQSRSYLTNASDITYLSNSSNSTDWFLKAEGKNTTLGGDLILKDKILSTGNIQVSSPQNIQFRFDSDNDNSGSVSFVSGPPIWGLSESRLLINHEGNVGIGEVNPKTKLDVNGVISTLGGNSENWNEAFLITSSIGDKITSRGTDNLFLGKGSAGSITSSAESNVGVGNNSLEDLTDGDENVSLGTFALSNTTVGDRNVAMGHQALISNVSGEGNVAIGYQAGPENGNTSLNNSIAIGYQAQTTASNQVRLGNYQIEDIGGTVSWSTVSDGRFKSNIEEDISGLDFINKLNPVSYNLDQNKINKFYGIESNNTAREETINNARQTGFIAQEVEQVVEETGFTFNGVHKPVDSKDHYSIRYSEFVVPLTKAIQELTTMIEDQNKIIADLKKEVASLKSDDTPDLLDSELINNGAELLQNSPNPFTVETKISMVLPQEVNEAKIIIYDLKGTELKSMKVTERGNASVNLSGYELESGMYFYALIVDGNVIDTKRMILTK